MPAQYTEIKNSYLSRGKNEKDAKRIAAMTFIAHGKGGSRHSRAVSLHSDKPGKRFPMGRRKRPVAFGAPK